MVYTAFPLYRVLALASALLVLLFVWQLRTGFDAGALLFLALMLWLALRFGRMALSRVEVLADRVRLLRPFSAPQVVEFRQLEAVYEEGRGFSSILVTYHPRQPDGLLDLEEVKHLSLPAVNDHAGLLATLIAHIPR